MEYRQHMASRGQQNQTAAVDTRHLNAEVDEEMMRIA